MNQSCWNPVASRVNEKTGPEFHNGIQTKSALESLFSINFIISFPLYIRDTSSHSVPSLIGR